MDTPIEIDLIFVFLVVAITIYVLRCVKLEKKVIRLEEDNVELNKKIQAWIEWEEDSEGR